jgi:hypothetical protein
MVSAHIRMKSSAAAIAAGSPDLRAISRWAMATHASFVEALIRAMASREWARSASIAALLRPCFSALALPFGAPRFRDSRGAELILLSGKKFEGGIPLVSCHSVVFP